MAGPRQRTVIAIAAAGIAVGAAGCSAGGGGGARPWTIASCQVDVTYVDQTTTIDYYVPDTDANFQQHYVHNQLSADAGMAVVITFVNKTGRRAALPTGLVVSFTDHSGNSAGDPQTFNNADGTGYGPAVVNGHGSGETFSASTLFNPGWTVAESPDIGASVPHLPDLNCRVSRP